MADPLFTSYAGYPKAAPVWAEIRIALAKREILPLLASLGPGRDPELDRERATPARGKENHRPRGTWPADDRPRRTARA